MTNVRIASEAPFIIGAEYGTTKLANGAAFIERCKPAKNSHKKAGLRSIPVITSSYLKEVFFAMRYSQKLKIQRDSKPSRVKNARIIAGVI